MMQLKRFQKLLEYVVFRLSTTAYVRVAAGIIDLLDFADVDSATTVLVQLVECG
jgi:hypothetical protein